MSLIDFAIIALFVAYAIWSGFSSRHEASQDLEQYFLAGRTLPGWKAGISMAATQFAADTPLLVTGLIATAGVFALWRLWIYALAFLLLGFVLAGSWRRLGVLTDAELTEHRYGHKPAAILRGVKAIYFGTLFNCTVLAMVLFAAKEIAEPFLRWYEWLPAGVFNPLCHVVETLGISFASPVGDAATLWQRSTSNIISIGALVMVTTLYSTTGGLRSVVQTDVMQFALMMLATLGYTFWVVHEVGGLGALSTRLHALFAQGGPGGISPEQLLALTPSRAKDAGLAVLAVYALQWLVQMNADGTGYLAQRSMACRSEHDAKLAAVIFTVAQVFLRSLMWLPLGLGLLVLFPPDLTLSGDMLKVERETTFVRGILTLLPPGLLGLMVTGMLAALASTVDTHLNWGSSYWTNDIYKRFVCPLVLKRTPKPKELVWVARIANLCILATALAVMTQLNSIQTAWQLSLLLGAGMGVMLVLRWMWWRVTARGELACIVASAALAPTLLWTVDDEALRLLLMALGATVAGIGASFAWGPESPETLRNFYQRAKPPGFWGPWSNDGNAGVRRLWHGLLATGLAAFSLFCILIACATLLIGGPSPTWMPWRGVWIAVTFLVGVGLVPVWWRLGFGGSAQHEPTLDSDASQNRAS